ncbi:hypothetical protein R1flu_024502 [Riccia fluitans]|uniref:Uncharacterized protein n=1 Tax=Riccia fluitans TaxID=41844 RepID=A0ABD1XV35_9MARC
MILGSSRPKLVASGSALTFLASHTGLDYYSLSGASLVHCESRRVREKLQTLVRRWLKQNVITLTVGCLGK